MGRVLAELLQRRRDRPALRVPQHYGEPRAEARRRELHAAHLGRRHDVPGDPDDEEIAESEPEHQLRGNPGVGAPQDDGERLLCLGEREARRLAGGGGGRGALEARDKGAVARPQPRQRFLSGNHDVSRRCAGRPS